jgi:hypothetical protein
MVRYVLFNRHDASPRQPYTVPDPHYVVLVLMGIGKVPQLYPA